MAKKRLDVLLVDRGLADSRERARALIMSGNVYTDNHLLDKPGTRVLEDISIYVKETLPFVSRGGLKLDKAKNVFGIDFDGKTVLDIGASTGGFTDVALQNGAKKVVAVDVGKNQLHYSLTKNPRVVNLQKVNFRYIEFEHIGEKCDIIVCDVSFISLRMIIPKVILFCNENTEAVFLIKPQFEAEKNEVGKNGVVRDSGVHERVILKIINAAEELSLQFAGLAKSPIKGPKGNVEYLSYFMYSENINKAGNISEIIERVVNDEEYSYCCKTSC